MKHGLEDKAFEFNFPQSKSVHGQLEPHPKCNPPGDRQLSATNQRPAVGAAHTAALLPISFPSVLNLCFIRGYSFTDLPVAADLSAAKMILWLTNASARLVSGISLPTASASKKAWNCV